jgi:hypothetical protein
MLPSSFSPLDLEFHFPFGWGELWGIADRGNYDLKCHSDASGKMMDMEVKRALSLFLPPFFILLAFVRYLPFLLFHPLALH